MVEYCVYARSIVGKRQTERKELITDAVVAHHIFHCIVYFRAVDYVTHNGCMVL